MITPKTSILQNVASDMTQGIRQRDGAEARTEDQAADVPVDIEQVRRALVKFAVIDAEQIGKQVRIRATQRGRPDRRVDRRAVRIDQRGARQPLADDLEGRAVGPGDPPRSASPRARSGTRRVRRARSRTATTGSPASSSTSPPRSDRRRYVSPACGCETSSSTSRRCP